jgi:hypothetical protein
MGTRNAGLKKGKVSIQALNSIYFYDDIFKKNFVTETEMK